MRGILAMVLAGCSMLSGCLEFEQKVTLRADGSGTQTVRMTVQEKVLRDLRQAQPAAHLGEAGDPTAVFDEQRVRAELTEAGLELTAHQVDKTAQQRTVELTAAFGSFAVLQKSPLCGSSAEWELAAGPRPGTGRLTLYPQGKLAWQEARKKAEQMRGESDPLVEAFFQKRREQLAGLDVRMCFELPGDVLVWTNNMEKVGAREVAAVVKAEQIKTPEDLVRRLAPRFEVIFDARGCTFAR
ncbi:MAG: hypothetical protein H6835_17200 [Planctomycetes bacterium]|nr:hypothetical protein [Planctomycetota bacterium]